MSSQPEDPNDTLQRLLSRKKANQSYSATDAAMLDARTESRDTQTDSRKGKPCPPPRETRGSRFWFDAR